MSTTTAVGEHRLLDPERDAEFCDPRGTQESRSFTPAPRLESLRGTTIALLSNQKRNADVILTEMAAVLEQEYGVSATITEVKEAMSLPAPPDQLRSLAQRAEAIIIAVGDCGSCSATTVMDAIAAERLGVPAIAVVTDQFRSGADMVAEIQGAAGYPIAYIPHPVATLDHEDLRSRARAAVDAGLAYLLAG